MLLAWLLLLVGTGIGKMADLSEKYVKENFRYENGRLIRLNWKGFGYEKEVGTDTKSGYQTFGVDYRVYKVHRTVWILFNGKIPRGLFIDHINGMPSDNRIENLRLADSNQNQHNKKKAKNKSSKYKGVSYKKKDNVFQSCIMFERKYVHIGSFKDENSAAIAYNKKAKELFGDRARLNEVVDA